MCSIDYHRFNSKTWASPQSNMLMRNHFTRKKSHPWPAQIRDNLGSVLGNIVLRTLPLEIQEIIGIEKRLNGPGKQLWNSPSNQLLGKHKLIPYKSPREVLAFTHDKIQNLGDKIEKKIARRVVKKMLKLAQMQEELGAKNMEQKVSEMRKKTIREFYVLMSFRLRELHKQMKEDFTDAWAKREAQLLEEANFTRNKGIQSIKSAFACEMKATARGLEREYNAKLNFMVEWAKNNYRDEYLQQKKHLLHKWSDLFEHAKRKDDAKMREMLEIVQTQNQLHFDAAILAERQNAAKVFLEIVQLYQDKWTDARTETDKLVSSLQTIIEERNSAQIDANAWQCALKDIMGQFQKFINYVLKEMPGQAEYLLSLREIAEKRRECLPRADRRIGEHQTLGRKVTEDACWEEILRLTEQEIPRVPSGSSLNLPKTVVEEEEGLKKENTLREIANGERVEQTRQMVMEATDWLLEGVKSSQNASKRDKHPVQEDKEEEIRETAVRKFGQQKLTRLSQEEKAKTSTSAKEELDEKLRGMTERDGGPGGPTLVGARNDPPEHCSGPFIKNRIQSLLDIFDSHPHLKNVFIAP